MKETHPLAVVDGVTYVNLLELEGLAKKLLTPNAYGYYSGGAEVRSGSILAKPEFALALNGWPAAICHGTCRSRTAHRITPAGQQAIQKLLIVALYAIYGLLRKYADRAHTGG